MTTLSANAPITEVPARFRDLLVSEWIKLWSLRSTYYVLGLGTLALIALNVNAAIADYTNWPTYSPAQRAGFSPLQDAFGHSAYLLLMLAAGSIGAITIVSEYSSGLIRTTFTAVPARRSVVIAKIAVMAAVMLAVGTAIAAFSFWLTQAILSGRHAGWSVSHPGVLQAAAASALLVPVCALVGMGTGALIRHTATTIVAVVVVLDLLPSFLGQAQRHPWLADVHNALPLIAWQRLRFTGPDHSLLDPTITGSWIVYLLWPLVAAILAVIVVDRRDV
jgi:ABC-2 type transport system permease protein